MRAERLGDGVIVSEVQNEPGRILITKRDGNITLRLDESEARHLNHWLTGFALQRIGEILDKPPGGS